MSYFNNSEDGCILELAQLRNLDPPSPGDISRLKNELKDLAAASKLTSDSDTCWHSDYEDDFAVIKTEARKSKKLNIWARFILNVIKWELWTWKKVCGGPPLPCPFRSFFTSRLYN